ncbi:DUF58 domain-containing protein [Portibacter marinus]|uniref:DUF58 domain-containing protein n=1 Tax=Portibacter marinus TaxID=2898660 RepID=UPI001F37430E|nr:DUF58 domain-containing protein [Portibacter marinus]
MRDVKEILKKVRKIEIKTKRLSKHLFSGEYHSAFKGRGMSFSEVRAYNYGDDVRNIDWNVTARTNEAHVKVYEEERELTVMLLIDVSKSSFFGTSEQFKNDYITELAAVISFSAITNNDKVGAILFTDQVEMYIPPKKGRQHILRIIREMIYFEPKSNGTDLKEPLQYLNNIIKKKSIAFIISDFITDDYEESLRVAAKKHDIIGLHVFDRYEKTLPNVGLISVIDAETGQKKVLDTSSESFRTKYELEFLDRQARFLKNFQKLGLKTTSISTDDDYIKEMIKLFKSY